MTDPETQNFAYHVGRTVGKYKLESLIGRGGMAEVYKTVHPELGRDLAIKILHPFYTDTADFVARFRREAQAAAALRHPNIVQIYDFDVTEDGLYYMVMEYIDGMTLEAYLAQANLPLPLSEAAVLFDQIAAALHFAHQKGTIHRDIKPANIMLDQNRHIFLADFGIAQIVGGSRLTQSGMTTGTPAFMAPEQVRGESVTAAADIYALGVILYYMVTGQYPHQGDSPLTLMMNKVAALPTPPTQFVPDLPADVEAIILTALAQQPEDRFADAQAMAAALRRAANGDDAVSTPPLQPALTTSPALTHQSAAVAEETAASKTAVSTASAPTATTPPWIWGVIAVGAVALVAVGFLLARGAGNTPETVFATPSPSAAAVLVIETAVTETAVLATASLVPPTPTASPSPTPLPALPGMTFIPAGSFMMGNDSGNGDEAPVHEVALDAYFIDTTEATNADYADFVATTGHPSPADWRQPDPSLWQVTASEPYIVGGPDNHFAYDGQQVRPMTGTLTMTVDADTNKGLIIATFNGSIQPVLDGDVYEGVFRIEQDYFSDKPTFPAFKEGGLGDFVHMHGLSGQEFSLYPELTAIIGTWGSADLYLNDELLFSGLGIHIMYTNGVREDGTNIIRRADGTCCFTAAAPGDGFVDPDEQEISIWLFAGSDYAEAQDFWINVYYNQVDVLAAPEFTGPPTFTEGLDDYPVTQITWEDAAAFCAWREARLPTEAEWEYAARGNTGYLYPWGDAKGQVQANTDNRLSGPAPVGSFPDAASPFGIQDMSGNVWEWTADRYSASYYQRATKENPTGPTTGQQRVLRGGSFRILDFLGQDEARTTHRRAFAPDQTANDIGFRCVVPFSNEATP